ncbi:glutamate decarboxylase 1-like isoform X2 [Oscarella lobularis]|uniref:glutamate decarboxylase 1-like isoform X2 n=1 Tax=Oscarella lobularis TaxID=121494 RepID=UPI003313DAB5
MAENGLKNAKYTDLLPWSSAPETTKSFVTRICALLLEYVETTFDRSTKVVDFMQPEDLKTKIDLDLRDEPENLDKIVDLCRTSLEYSVRSGHPYFFNQLFAGIDVVALMGDFLSSTVNVSMYTYEMGSVFVLMEQEVLKKMRSLIGFEKGDGIFAPGGSMSNIYGMNLARYKMFPEVKTKGMRALPPLVMFTSEEGHYSVQKSANLLGMGTDSVIAISTDDVGRIVPGDLRAKVLDAKSKGYCPFMVNATSGTTVRGAFDPLNAIADICQEFGMWLHIDAAWGGAVLLSRKHRHLMKGSHRADSVTWNPHKMMGVPLQCSAFMTKHEGVLQECNSAHATYLFQKDKKQYDVSLDTGDKAIQCGRHVDIAKLWLSWKARGNSGYERKVNHAFEMAQYLTDQVRKREGFQLVTEPEYVNIGFWYFPPSIRDLPDGPEKTQKLHKVGPEVKKGMTKKGSLLVGYQICKEFCNYFRMIVHNEAVGKADMDYVLDEVERLGKDLKF